MGLFNVKCDEAGHICDKSQYNEAKLWDIIKLKIHHAYCKVCREHSKRNTILTQLIKSSKIQTLDTKAKVEMQAKLNEELAKNQ